MAESFATQLQAAKTSADISLKECLKKMHMAEEAHETALQSLQVKVSDLQEQQKSREETETVHEDYKKRAQHALKKANAAAALRTLEIETLQKELEDTKAEMTSIQQHQATLSNSEAAATSTHEALLVRCQQFEDEKKSWEEEMRVLKAACEQAKASAASATATAAPGASAITAASDSPPQVAHPLPVPSLQHLDTLPQKKQKESPASSVQKQQQSPPTSPDDASRSPVLASANEVNSNASRRSTSPSASEGSRSEAGGLFYTSTLKTELQELRGMLSSRAVEIETLRRSLQSEKGQRVKLETQREELIAFIDRTKAASGGDSSVNMEYLKNCVMRFMATVELNEKKKLFPVIATILKLTAPERDEVEGAFVQQERFALADGLSGTLNSVRSFWGGGK
jgi:predicted  nucleic acid-binding Zn-ribbon protein